MARTSGAKDKNPRKRKAESEPKKQSKHAAKAAASERAKQAFVSNMTRASTGAASSGAGASKSADAAAASDECSGSDMDPETPEDDEMDDGDAGAPEEDDDSRWEEGGLGAANGGNANVPRREHRPADVEAELDDDEQLDDAEGGVMATYLQAVFERLHSEVSGDTSRSALEHKWLLELLKAPGADWWLRAGLAEAICERLGIEFGEPSYYRDIYVWLPDVRWGELPPCVECHSAAEVGPHAFRENHFGRRICGLNTHYFAMSRRYCCSGCKQNAMEVKQAAKERAEAAGLSIKEMQESADAKPQYTFMGYDARSRARLPHGYGDEFPAFLTHRGGVDLLVIDLMRPLFNKGLRPEACSATLLELHTKAYTKAYLKRENLLELEKKKNETAQRLGCAVKKTAAMYMPNGL